MEIYQNSKKVEGTKGMKVKPAKGIATNSSIFSPKWWWK
jgi:hypothetical protein|tara:strand:- start:278 stop:394 length:117 start_codon:yes stop_codon:yes gene_type:complete